MLVGHTKESLLPRSLLPTPPSSYQPDTETKTCGFMWLQPKEGPEELHAALCILPYTKSVMVI